MTEIENTDLRRTAECRAQASLDVWRAHSFDDTTAPERDLIAYECCHWAGEANRLGSPTGLERMSVLSVAEREDIVERTCRYLTELDFESLLLRLPVVAELESDDKDSLESILLARDEMDVALEAVRELAEGLAAEGRCESAVLYAGATTRTLEVDRHFARVSHVIEQGLSVFESIKKHLVVAVDPSRQWWFAGIPVLLERYAATDAEIEALADMTREPTLAEKALYVWSVLAENASRVLGNLPKFPVVEFPALANVMVPAERGAPGPESELPVLEGVLSINRDICISLRPDLQHECIQLRLDAESSKTVAKFYGLSVFLEDAGGMLPLGAVDQEGVLSTSALLDLVELRGRLVFRDVNGNEVDHIDLGNANLSDDHK